MLKKLSPNVMVKSVPKSIDFYKKVLGFKVSMRYPQKGKPVWASLCSGEVEIMIQDTKSLGQEIKSLKGKKTGGSLVFYIRVTGIKNLYSRVKSKVKIIQKLNKTFYGNWEFTIQDPDGYLLTFAQRG